MHLVSSLPALFSLSSRYTEGCSFKDSGPFKIRAVCFGLLWLALGLAVVRGGGGEQVCRLGGEGRALRGQDGEHAEAQVVRGPAHGALRASDRPAYTPAEFHYRLTFAIKLKLSRIKITLMESNYSYFALLISLLFPMMLVILIPKRLHFLKIQF